MTKEKTAADSGLCRMFTARDFPQLLDEASGKWINVPEDFQLQGFAEHTPFVPKISSDYVFRKELFFDIANYLRSPHGHALWLSGPAGSGKTSVITELAGRLNWGAVSITATDRLEFDDLVGRPQVIAVKGEAPSVRFVYGPLARAMKFGMIFILNEIDLVDPSQLSGLNDILEGRPLFITGNGGEAIYPHEMFRFVATANSRGGGDDTGAYPGIQIQNLAALDRYRILEVDYLPAKAEQKVLEALFPDLGRPLCARMVKVAAAVRSSFLEGTLSTTMSTRTLVFWCHLLKDYSNAPIPLKESLRLSFANRLSPEERITVYTVAQQTFGGTGDWIEED